MANFVNLAHHSQSNWTINIGITNCPRISWNQIEMCFAVTANRNPYLLIIFDLYFVWVSVLFDFENAFVYIMSFHWAIIILLWLLNNWVCVCVFCLYSTCSLESRQTLFGLPFGCGCSSISIATTAQHLWLRTRSTTSALLFTFMPIRRILSLALSLSPLSVAHFHFFPLIQSSPAVAVDIVLWFLLFSRLFFLKVILFQYSKHCVYGSVFPATTFHSVMPIILSDEFRSVEWKKRHRTFLPSAGVALTIRFNLYDCFCIVDISIFLYFFRTFFSPFVVSSWNIDCIRRFSMWLAVLFVFFGCGANQTI